MGIYSLIHWGLVIIIGFTAQFFILRYINKDKRVHSHLEGHIRKLWIVSEAAFFPAGFLCIQLGIDPPTIICGYLIQGYCLKSAKEQVNVQ